MPSFSEWLDANPQSTLAKATGLEQRRAQRLVMLRMEDLLASDDWGAYRQHLEALIASEDEGLASVQAQILGDAVGDELGKLKAQAREIKGRRDGLQMARDLPESLRGLGKSLSGAAE